MIINEVAKLFKGFTFDINLILFYMHLRAPCFLLGVPSLACHTSLLPRSRTGPFRLLTSWQLRDLHLKRSAACTKPLHFVFLPPLSLRDCAFLSIGCLRLRGVVSQVFLRLHPWFSNTFQAAAIILFPETRWLRVTSGGKDITLPLSLLTRKAIYYTGHL